jgi:hypothetical protein
MCRSVFVVIRFGFVYAYCKGENSKTVSCSQQRFIPLKFGIYVIPTADTLRLHDEDNPIIFVQGNNRFLL